MRVNIINKSNNALPAYETASSAGMDLRAFVDADVVLKPFERKLIPTGLYIELPDGYEAQIRPANWSAVCRRAQEESLKNMLLNRSRY